MSGYKKFIVVVIGAIGFSVLGIQAADTLRGLETGLSGLVTESTGPCGPGEQEMFFGDRALCVDVYEASPSAGCPHQIPANQIQTQDNLNETTCSAATQPEVVPWRYVSLVQAQQLCARVGKRLPTNGEWYKIASGIAEQSACVTDSAAGAQPTGVAGCTTPAGIHDVIGNVWEWIEGEVTNGIYNDRTLPASGYVALVDTSGVVIETSSNPQAEFNDDYAWTQSEGVFGIIRGGFYGSETDAGIFAQNLSVALDTKTAGIGFRCVRDI